MTSSYFPGRNPLNYQGTNVTNPPQQYSFDRAPTPYDWETFNIGDEWRDSSTTPNDWYKLCSKARQAPPADANARAVWRPITAKSQNDLSTLTGNSGGAISPDSTGTINVVGASGQINVAGSGNTLTLSLTGGGTAIDSLLPDPGSGTSPVVPNGSGSVTMSGSGSIQSVGGTNQLTYELTGLTNHAVLVGAGTSTITKLAVGATGTILVGSTGADPAFASFAEADFAFTQSSAASATNRKIEVLNADTTSSASNAQIIAKVGGTSSGDPYFLTSVASSRSYAWGPDVSSSNTMKLTTNNSASVSPRTGTLLSSMTPSGIQTLPLQPSIKVYLKVSLPNVTGGSSGAFYQIVFDEIDYNQGSAFSYNTSTGLFTVPSNGTGIYLLSCNLNFSSVQTVTADTGFNIVVNGSSKYKTGLRLNPGTARSNVNAFGLNLMDQIQLNANDTVAFSVNLQSSTSPVANYIGLIGSDVSGGSYVTVATITKIA